MRSRIETLDYARFIAAISVLFFHYCCHGFNTGKISSIEINENLRNVSQYGYFGVHFFFMISGYVIFWSAQSKDPKKFIFSRMKRLYPAYWVSVLITSVVLALIGSEAMRVSLLQILANLTMLQGYLGYPNVDGVYWTLLVELKFYFLVFLLLMSPLKEYLERVFLVWPVIFLIAYWFQLSDVEFLGGHYYYFSAGALFAILSNKKSKALIGSLILNFFFCLNKILDQGVTISKAQFIDTEPLILAAITVSFFLFFIWIEAGNGKKIKLPKAALLGALTYPIYLIHAHVGYALIDNLANESNKIVIYLVVITLIILISYLIHFIVEKKMECFWNKLFGKSIDFIFKFPKTKV